MPRSTQAALLVLVLAALGGLFWRSSQLRKVPEPAAPPAPVARTEPRPSSEPAAAAPPPAPAPAPSASVPELPASAPKTVSFGVILVRYRGAEGAPEAERSRDAALTLAKSILQEARTDFDAAVKRGDPGSTPRAGTMPRGILEPPIEYALFTLGKGEMAPEPVDTPRGYWILRRND